VKATNEQIADATLAALEAAAGNEYFIQVTTMMLAERSNAGGVPKMPPIDQRRQVMKAAYNNTIKFLPADSPFLEPLERMRDQLIADMPEEAPPPGGN